MRYTLTNLVCVAVDPVVQGKTRAEQFYNGDESGRFIMKHLYYKLLPTHLIHHQ